MIAALTRSLDDAYHLAVNVFVLAVTPVIEDICELTFGGDDHASSQPE